ncbi:hypothetical protein KI387_010430, partial [Taxus chinensis]
MVAPPLVLLLGEEDSTGRLVELHREMEQISNFLQRLPTNSLVAMSIDDGSAVGFLANPSPELGLVTVKNK